MAAWRYEISLLVLKIFHSFAALTRETFFNTRREISYLRAPCNILYLFEGVAYWKVKFIWTLDTTKSYSTTVLLSTVLNSKKLTSLDFDYKLRRLFEGGDY